MGQYFLLMAPQKAERYFEYAEKLGEFLFRTPHDKLVSSLAVPVKPENSKSLIKTANTITSRLTKFVPKSPTALSKLPVELHDYIFENLSIDDIISLGQSCRYFWMASLKHIQNDQMNALGRWAGEQIICAGCYASPEDLPQGMFTEEEKQNLAQFNGGTGRYNLYRAGQSNYSVLHLDVNFWNDLLLKCQCKANVGWSIGYKFWRIMAKDIKFCYSKFYPSQQAWILRNLTTKELDRSEAVAIKPEYVVGPYIKGIGFGEVVLSRICWSTNSSTNMSEGTNIHRGVWAGHRFDITTIERHIRQTKEEDWSDISEEINKEISAIWENEYGENWREKVCKGCDFAYD